MSFAISVTKNPAILISSLVTPNGKLYVPSYDSHPSVSGSGFLYYNKFLNSLNVSTGINSWKDLDDVSSNQSLNSISNLNTSGNEIIYTIASDTYATSSITPIGRSFIGLNSTNDQQSALSLIPGETVQEYNSILDNIIAISGTSNKMLYTFGGSYTSSDLNPWARNNLLNVSSASSLISIINAVESEVLTTLTAIPLVSNNNSISESSVLIDSSNNITGIGDITLSGNITGISNLSLSGTLGGLTQLELGELGNIDTTTISPTQWSYIGSADQEVKTVSAPTFDGMTSTSDITMGANKITTSGIPTSGNDLANKTYVDNIIGGAGINPIENADVATITALEASAYASTTITEIGTTGVLTVDSINITVFDGKRIVVKNQADSKENGVYTRIADSSSSWVLQRDTGFDTITVLKNTYILVLGGTVNINTSWILQNDVTNFSTDVVIWSQFTSSQTLIPYDGITVAGTDWNIDPTVRFSFSGLAPNRKLELNTVTVPYGGTGVSTLTNGNVLIGNGNSAVTSLKASPTGDFLGTTDSQTLTNKTLTNQNNNIVSRALFSDSGSNVISGYSASNPSNGQVITATSANTFNWQNPFEYKPNNTLFVYKGASNVTPYYSTIKGALADTLAINATDTTQCLLRIFPGTYIENGSIQIPENCTLSSNSTIPNTVIVKSDTPGIIISMQGGCRLNGVTVDGEITPGSVYATVGISSFKNVSSIEDLVYNCVVKNFTTACIRVTGDGTQNGKLLVCKTTVCQQVSPGLVGGYGYECLAGATLNGNDFTSSAVLGSASMSKGIYCHDDYSYADISLVRITSADIGIEVGISTSDSQDVYPQLIILNGIISYYSINGLHVNNKSVIRCSDLRIEVHPDIFPSQIGLYFTNSSLPSDPNFISASQLNVPASSIVYSGASNNQSVFIGYNLSEDIGEIQTVFSGDFAVGLPDFGSETALGEGNSYTFGMVVFVHDAGIVSSTDKTANATLSDNITFDIFPPTPLISGDAVYIGGPFMYPGIKLDIVNSITVGSGNSNDATVWEYWNGVIWTVIPLMVSRATAPYSNLGNITNGYGDIGLNLYQYRFGDMSSWASTLAAGAGIVLPIGMSDSLRYYIRCRVTNNGITGGSSPITTIPSFDKIKLHTNKTQIDKDGFIEFFGKARNYVSQNIPIASIYPADDVFDSPTSTTIVVSSNPYVGHTVPNNTFRNGKNTGVGFVWLVPDGIDSSFPLLMNFSWSMGTLPQSNIRLQLNYVVVEDSNTVGNPTGSTLTGTTTGYVTYQTSSISNGNFNTNFTIDIPNIKFNSTIWFVISRNATNFEPLDTYQKSIYINGITVQHSIWSHGKYIV